MTNALYKDLPLKARTTAVVGALIVLLVVSFRYDVLDVRFTGYGFVLSVNAEASAP